MVGERLLAGAAKAFDEGFVFVGLVRIERLLEHFQAGSRRGFGGFGSVSGWRLRRGAWCGRGFSGLVEE